MREHLDGHRRRMREIQDLETRRLLEAMGTLAFLAWCVAIPTVWHLHAIGVLQIVPRP